MTIKKNGFHYCFSVVYVDNYANLNRNFMHRMNGATKLHLIARVIFARKNKLWINFI